MKILNLFDFLLRDTMSFDGFEYKTQYILMIVPKIWLGYRQKFAIFVSSRGKFLEAICCNTLTNKQEPQLLSEQRGHCP